MYLNSFRVQSLTATTAKIDGENYVPAILVNCTNNAYETLAFYVAPGTEPLVGAQYAATYEPMVAVAS